MQAASWRCATIVLTVVLMLVLWVRGSWPNVASAQDGRATMRVEIVDDNGKLLGAGDTRFGVTIAPGGGAVVADWKDFGAWYVDEHGSVRDLKISLKHQHTAIGIPSQGVVVIEDRQGGYYMIAADGRIEPLVLRQ